MAPYARLGSFGILASLLLGSAATAVELDLPAGQR